MHGLRPADAQKEHQQRRNLNNEHCILKLYGKRTNKSNKGCGNDKTKQFY